MKSRGSESAKIQLQEGREPFRRVLSLLPSATEIIYALGAGDRLAGATHECDYPREVFDRPRVTRARISNTMESDQIDAIVRSQLEDSGTLYTLDLDLVRALAPDLVLTQQLCTVCAVGYGSVVQAMASLDDPPAIVNLEPRTLDEVLGSFVDVAGMLGLAERGHVLVAQLRERLAAIPPLDRPTRVLLLEWLIPPFRAGHWMPALVRAAGADPVFTLDGTHSQSTTWEEIGREEFDLLAISCCGFGVERTLHDVGMCRELEDLRHARPDLRVIVLDGNHYFSRPGPRLVESAEMLNSALRGIPAERSGASIAEPYRELSPSR